MSKRRVQRPRALAASTALLLALVLAAACSSSGGTSGAGAAPGSTAAATNGGSGGGSGGGSANPSTSGKKYTIGYILTAPIEALEAIGNGLKKEADALGLGFEQVSANFSTDQQIAAMQAFEAKHVDVIITAPLVPASFFKAAQEARDKGIYVLTYNKAGPGVNFAVTNPDTPEASHIVGVLAEHLTQEGKPCNLGIIEGQPSTPPLLARDTGFEAGAKAAGCTVLAKQVATKTTSTEGSNIAHAWKTRFGSKMTGIVAINDEVAIGVLPARGGDFSPEVVSLNGEPAAVAAVKAGTMYADAGLENAVMGEALGYAADLLLQGKTVPSEASSPYFLITKDTADSFNDQFADATVLKRPAGKISFVQSGGQTVVQYAP